MLTQKLTYVDYAAIPFDRNRHEILDGEHIVTPSPNAIHQTVSRRIQHQLMSQIELKGLGEVYDAPFDVELSQHTIVQPDLIVVLKGNPIVTASRIKGTPDHIIEILSPSTAEYDRDTKFTLYEKAGVTEYWIVDTDEQAVRQYVLKAGVYEEREHTDQIATSYLAGVVVDFQKVW